MSGLLMVESSAQIHLDLLSNVWPIGLGGLILRALAASSHVITPSAHWRGLRQRDVVLVMERIRKVVVLTVHRVSGVPAPTKCS